MVGADGETFTDTAARTVTVAEPERFVSALDLAVTVTLEAETEAGAVYSPLVPIVPTVAFPPTTPFTLQVTPRFWESFCTVAVNCSVAEICSEAEAGETDTAIGAVTAIVADAVFEASATDVAVSVTEAGLGALAGAW